MDVLYAYPDSLVVHSALEMCADVRLDCRATELCRLMNFHGSDKAARHGYTRIYDRLLSRYCGEPLTLFELGIGTTSTHFRANMGERGIPGSSLRAWRDYFQNARIIGADIDLSVLFQENRIKTYHVDATSVASTQCMLSQALAGGQLIDVVVDDGPHLLSASLIFLMSSYPYLKKGGFHIIEDILDHPWAIIQYSTFFDLALKSVEMEWAAIVRVAHEPRRHDNCIAIFKKST